MNNLVNENWFHHFATAINVFHAKNVLTKCIIVMDTRQQQEEESERTFSIM